MHIETPKLFIKNCCGDIVMDLVKVDEMFNKKTK